MLKPDLNSTEEQPPEGFDKAKDLLRTFFAHSYKGEWSIKDPLDKERLQPSFESQNGVVLVSVFYLKLQTNGGLRTPVNSNKTYVFIANELFDGIYKEQTEYLILITELKNFTITESGIRIEFKDVIVQKHFLRLFTRLGDSICKANIVMDFTQKENNVMQGSLIFESLQSSCLPHEIKITLEYPFDSLISSKRVMNYTLIVFMML